MIKSHKKNKEFIMFARKMSNHISMSVLVVIMIAASSSFADSFSEKWDTKSIRYMFPESEAGNIKNDEPAKTVWRVLESVVDEDKDRFVDQYSEIDQQAIQKEFEKWKERLSHGYPTAIVLQGERDDGTAFVALYSSIRGESAPGAYFSDIILLQQAAENVWKIIPAIDNEEEIEYLEKIFLNERNEIQEQLLSEHIKKREKIFEEKKAEMERRTLEFFKETDGEENYERMLLREKREQELKAAGKKIPKQQNFNEMTEILDFDFFVPPQIFNARHDPGTIDSSKWREVTHKLLHIRWQNSELTPKVNKLDNIDPEAKSLVQVLFTISREVDNIPFKIVFFFAFDKDTDFTDQWVTPSKLVLAQDEHGDWSEKRNWSKEHIVFGRLTSILRDRIRFRSSDFGTMPGEDIRKAFEDSDLPPPLDRVYDVSKCVDFVKED